MKRRLYVAMHVALASSAVVIAGLGVWEITAGGQLSQGLIRLAIAFVVVASQVRGLYWDRREASSLRG